MHTPITANIHWVGAIDWDDRDFHGYAIRRGTTYNAYLVKDEKTALIDAVRAPFMDDLLANVSEVTEADKVDFIVVNHAEPDHAGGLPRAVAAFKNAQVVCDQKCRDELSKLFDTSGWNFRIVSDGEALSLGSRTLQFYTTPMVHWPESMVTFIPEDRVLFSMDAFGQHQATAARFDDEVPLSQTMEEAKHYFANILMPFGMPIQKTLKALAALSPAIVATSHGLIWRTHFDKILDAYTRWAAHAPEKKVLVLFDSMWGSTARMARAIAEGAGSVGGVEVKLLDIRHTEQSDVVADVLDAACFALGSPCQNGTILPTVGSLITRLKGLRPTRKQAFAFGSYGWSGKAAMDELTAFFGAIKASPITEPISHQFVPTPDVLKRCFEAGRLMAEKAKG